MYYKIKNKINKGNQRRSHNLTIQMLSHPGADEALKKLESSLNLTI